MRDDLWVTWRVFDNGLDDLERFGIGAGKMHDLRAVYSRRMKFVPNSRIGDERLGGIEFDQSTVASGFVAEDGCTLDSASRDVEVHPQPSERRLAFVQEPMRAVIVMERSEGRGGTTPGVGGLVTCPELVECVGRGQERRRGPAVVALAGVEGGLENIDLREPDGIAYPSKILPGVIDTRARFAQKTHRHELLRLGHLQAGRIATVSDSQRLGLRFVEPPKPRLVGAFEMTECSKQTQFRNRALTSVTEFLESTLRFTNQVDGFGEATSTDLNVSSNEKALRDPKLVSSCSRESLDLADDIQSFGETSEVDEGFGATDANRRHDVDITPAASFRRVQMVQGIERPAEALRRPGDTPVCPGDDVIVVDGQEIGEKRSVDAIGFGHSTDVAVNRSNLQPERMFEPALTCLLGDDSTTAKCSDRGIPLIERREATTPSQQQASGSDPRLRFADEGFDLAIEAFSRVGILKIGGLNPLLKLEERSDRPVCVSLGLTESRRSQDGHHDPQSHDVCKT